ncbi:MFS transporter [Humibacillus sp. DSM 29435]|uniref:MFS transporter n=1 Tax=Humibacillus sp. DSM 29435 TaxID=1869167 RepID=UPI001C30B3E8|nr:MFS transporter [Humibacillus sp. DSM 29435]
MGAASLCSDTGHELVTALLPTLVTSTLHAGPAALGAIDGVADALTGLAKLAGGPLAADPARRGRLAAGGYVGTAFATAGIGLATAVWQVAALRSLAWVARGVRSPARDTLLTDLAPVTARGRAFGVERAGDNLGAVLGPVLAAVLVGVLGVRHAMVLSIVPSLLAAVAITVAAREARTAVDTPVARQRLALRVGELRLAGMTRVLRPLGCFELGNLASTLLILRATGLLTSVNGWTGTRAASTAILLYAFHNVAAAASAPLAGRLADRRGPTLALASGAAAYVLAYLLLAIGPGMPGLLIAFLLAGFGIGFGETAASTAVANATPDALRGNAFGLYGLVQAGGDLGSTVVAGLLWSWFGPGYAFGYAATWMVLAVLLAPRLQHRRRGSRHI